MLARVSRSRIVEVVVEVMACQATGMKRRSCGSRGTRSEEDSAAWTLYSLLHGFYDLSMAY